MKYVGKGATSGAGYPKTRVGSGVFSYIVRLFEGGVVVDADSVT